MRNRRRSVLIADNNRAMAQSLRMHLERDGFSVFVAHDLEQATILAARQRFELMLVSFELPKNGAIEFCQHVREELNLTEVPIAICSPAGLEAEIESMQYRFGVSRVFYQPINPANVVAFATETVEYSVSSN